MERYMRKVIGIGETVLDIIFRDGQPIGAVPGGSVFNGVISLGRAGVPATFISEAGNDRVGDTIVQFLHENGVNADHVNRFPGSKSPISLAFLDDNNDADYIFYKDHPHDQLDFVYPDVQADDIVMFGSFYAVNPVIRPQVHGFLEYAKQKGAILYYDVNFRASHKDDLMKWNWRMWCAAVTRTSISCSRKTTATRCTTPRYRSIARSSSTRTVPSRWSFVLRACARAILSLPPRR